MFQHRQQMLHIITRKNTTALTDILIGLEPLLIHGEMLILHLLKPVEQKIWHIFRTYKDLHCECNRLAGKKQLIMFKIEQNNVQYNYIQIKMWITGIW